LTVFPFGFTTWAAFVYIGIRARRPRWLAWAAVYAALLAGYLALDATAGHSSVAAAVAAVLALLAWIGGGVHAFAVSDDAARRIQDRADPALDAARTRIERRAEGRRLLARQPALAKEIGLGRPDISGADDYGLVDVNHASPATLARLPGVTDEVVRQIADRRAQAGGFSSVEDLGLVLDLPPGMVEQIRDTAVFIPD
jgi:DNA uptake protein ComE-like DNA-binding protein